MSEKQPKFVVAGAGLVGCLAAVYLSKLGFNVIVYEYRDDMRKKGKVEGKSINLALSRRGLNALKNAGIEWNSIHHMLVPMKGRMIHKANGSREILLYDVKYNQNIYSIGRNDLNKMLLDEAEKNVVELRFGCKVTKVDFENHVLHVIRMQDGAQIEENFDYLIGCDGAYSTVRYHMLKTSLFNYSQRYIDHGYMELCIPAADGAAKMMPNHLHIWPRLTFMMIALPNQNGSWTVTLFMPFRQFEEIENGEDLVKFFRHYFEDALPLIGEENLIDTYFSSKAQPLISIKCDKYVVGTRSLIIGDAAHAVVPFYGQGMNAGFEDCYILYEILKGEKLTNAFEEFSNRRTVDTHAISDLSMYNYLEMRNLVMNKRFLIRKKMDNLLYTYLGNIWKPLYVCVTFSAKPYSQCLSVQRFQNKVLKILFSVMTVSMCFLALFGISSFVFI